MAAFVRVVTAAQGTSLAGAILAGRHLSNGSENSPNEASEGSSVSGGPRTFNADVRR